METIQQNIAVQLHITTMNLLALLKEFVFHQDHRKANCTSLYFLWQLKISYLPTRPPKGRAFSVVAPWWLIWYLDSTLYRLFFLKKLPRLFQTAWIFFKKICFALSITYMLLLLLLNVYSGFICCWLVYRYRALSLHCFWVSILHNRISASMSCIS